MVGIDQYAWTLYSFQSSTQNIPFGPHNYKQFEHIQNTKYRTFDKTQVTTHNTYQLRKKKFFQTISSIYDILFLHFLFHFFF